MKLETAFLRAAADYKSVGKGYDSVIPAYRLAERIPRQTIRNLPVKIYAYESGRQLLKDLETLLIEETTDLGEVPQWALPKKPKSTDAEGTVYSTVNSFA
ncbi:hypothetical protein GGI12_006315 [Dipsacomyces acuminosporus]|nr:hypothetical protein GGI12_006315 [Dipsacomyces acuminosporus]